MLCDCKLCWVCELSATLLSYSSLTLCHQPQCHEYPFGPVVSKWVVSFLGHSFRCFSLKCGSTWKHQIQTIGWYAHAQRMYPMLTSHCDLPLLAAWIRSECPPYFGCLASVLEALLIDLMLDGLLPRFSRQPMAWGREDMGTLTSRPAMNLLWTCYEPAMNVRLNAGAELWLLRGHLVAKNTSMACDIVLGITPQKSASTILLTGSLWQADEDQSLYSQHRQISSFYRVRWCPASPLHVSEGCLVWRCFKITQVPAVAFVALCVPSSDFFPGHIHQISPGSCWSQGLCLTANFLGVEATGTSQLCIEFDSVGFGRPWKPQGKSLKRHLPKLAKSAANLIPVVSSSYHSLLCRERRDVART